MRKELPASRLMSGLAFFFGVSASTFVGGKHGGFKPWGKKRRKTMGKPWENGDLSKKNVDLIGFIAYL